MPHNKAFDRLAWASSSWSPRPGFDGEREWFGSRGSHGHKKSIRVDCPKQDGGAVDVRAPRAARSARDFSARAAAPGVLAVWASGVMLRTWNGVRVRRCGALRMMCAAAPC